MNEAYRQLSEGVPARKSAGTLAFPTDGRKIKAWIDALPRANQALTHRQLDETLDALADVRLDGGQRLAVMELLRPVLLEACAALAAQVQGSSLPLPPAKARMMEQLIEVERKLAHAYRLATIELCAPSGGVPFLRGGTVLLAVERAIYHRSRDMLRAYALYRQPADGAWRDLHALYQFARSHRMEQKPIEEPAESRTLTIEQLYLQALLLALSNPYRFSQREQVELWGLARDFAPHLVLGKARPAEDAFAIPASGDEGPGYIAEERAEERGDLLWLSLSGLRQAFERPLEDTMQGPVRIRIGATVVESTAELLSRLRSGWGTSAERSHQRLSAGHALETVFGLSGVHFHLAGGMDLDGFLRQAGVPASKQERDRHDWTHSGLDSGRVPVFRAAVLDQSLGGYRVRWPAEEHVRARVGELVGLSMGSDQETRQWMLGVIRWLRYANDDSVDAGIELLARRARPVALRSLDPGVTRPRFGAVQFEPVRGHVDGRLRFAVPSVLESIGGDLDVVRVTDEFDPDHDEPGSERFRNARVLESAGDHSVVEAERAG